MLWGTYSEYEADKRGRVKFYIPHYEPEFFKGDLKEKTFSLSAILDRGVSGEFLNEVAFWDGSVYGKGFTYCSTNKENIDVVQAIAHIHKRTANYGVQNDSRPIFKKTPKPYYRLNVSKRDKFKTDNLKRTEEWYEGNVYCVTVPSGIIMVRQNGKVFVTGNCQNLTIAEIKSIVTRLGDNSQIILTGDSYQSDLKPGESGLDWLCDLIEKYNIDGAEFVEFLPEDICSKRTG